MPFLSSIFCCAAQTPSEKADLETRRARIVSAVNHHQHYSTTRPRSRPQSPRYHDSPPSYKDAAEDPLLTIDEKNAADFNIFADGNEVEEADEDDSAPPPLSPHSSVISIPSTRLTDLTSMQTGETVSILGRGSLERYPSQSTRPPSYYNTPRRSPSPALSAGGDREEQRDDVWLHPVMHNNWLQVLREDALRRSAAAARTTTVQTRAQEGNGDE